MSEPSREPYCIHTGLGPQQPMSMCVVCRDGPTLAKWAAYWRFDAPTCRCGHAPPDHGAGPCRWVDDARESVCLCRFYRPSAPVVSAPSTRDVGEPNP